jgi:hypothetical protein
MVLRPRAYLRSLTTSIIKAVDSKRLLLDNLFSLVPDMIIDEWFDVYRIGIKALNPC